MSISRKFWNATPDSSENQVAKKGEGHFLAPNGIVWTWQVNESMVYRLLEARAGDRMRLQVSPEVLSILRIFASFLFALCSSGVFARSSAAKAFMQIAVSLLAEAGKCLLSRASAMLLRGW